MRTQSAGMQAHLAGRSHSRCIMLRLALTDGTIIGGTDHDKAIEFDLLGDTETYEPNLFSAPSNIVLVASLDADNCEVTGPITDTISRENVLAGRFNRAAAWVFEVNHKSLADGASELLKGKVTEARIEGGRFVFQIRSDKDGYNQTVGETITNNCKADFADGIRCFATATEVLGTVTAAASAGEFTVSFTGSYADDFFNKGTVIGLTGANAGTVIEIEDWTAAGVVKTFMPLGTVPSVGDTFTIRNGCGKSRADCMAHNAIEWFRGYPEVPGRKALMPAVPGA